MITCSTCAGEGLTGAGPRPWALEGRVTTCPACNGTGTFANEPGTDVQSQVDEIKEIEADQPA